MDQLLKLLDANFDDAEGSLRIVDADWFGDDLKLSVSIQCHNDHDPELWEIACGGVVEESLSAVTSGELTVSTDSPLLRMFVEPQVQIMFAGNALAAEALLGIVCSCCMEVMGRAETITRFMNGAPTVKGIASSAYGLLGEFPQSLAEQILKALDQKPIQAHALTGWLPVKWDGAQRVSYPRLQIVEIGTSYVIAEQFSACRA